MYRQASDFGFRQCYGNEMYTHTCMHRFHDGHLPVSRTILHWQPGDRPGRCTPQMCASVNQVTGHE